MEVRETVFLVTRRLYTLLSLEVSALSGRRGNAIWIKIQDSHEDDGLAGSRNFCRLDMVTP